MSILNNSLLLGADAGAAGYEISRSLRFNSSDSAYLSRTPASSGNRKTWTWSGWVKRSALGGDQVLFGACPNPGGADNDHYGLLISGDALWSSYYTGSQVFQCVTSAVLRDTSAWYHITVAFDTTQATASNRIKIYVNGSLQSLSTANYPSLNYDGQINSAIFHSIGKHPRVSSSYLSGYLAEVFFIDGQALDPSSFTEVSATTGQLIPKAYTGSFGTNGFWLKFSDNSAATATTLGKDYSGNSNNWTPNNLSVTAGAGNDSLTDSPTSYGSDTGAGGEVRGNYCTWNPLDTVGKTLSNGNLDGTNNSSGISKGTIAVGSGKWYWEVTVTSSSGGYSSIGIAEASAASSSAYLGSSASTWSYYQFNGQIYTNGSGTSYGASYTTGDVIGVALDLDNDRVTFYKNGVSQGIAVSNLTGTYVPAWGNDQSGPAISANFGQRSWAYAAPAGFKALVDTNLTAPVVAKSSDYFQTVLWTGNSSTQTVSGLSFSPDLVWLKCRNDAYGHRLLDTVRGATIGLASQSTAAESTESTGLTAFNSDGFTLGSNVTYNESAKTYVGWAFDAGTTTTTNTAGSITSSCRTNQSSGFSIVTWSVGTAVNNSTIGHGLNAAPSLIICKTRTASNQNWIVYHRSLGTGDYLALESTQGSDTRFSTIWGTSAPTSTVFGVGNSGFSNNTSNNSYVAYCWAPVAGYSSFGSYVGTGAVSTGPFCYTGFRPRLVILKAAVGGTSGWIMVDTARNTYNAVDYFLQANSSGAESAQVILDAVSNGFVIRPVGDAMNNSGVTFVWAAFAESPFQYARAR